MIKAQVNTIYELSKDTPPILLLLLTTLQWKACVFPLYHDLTWFKLFYHLNDF
jgi:hypothetical protein